MSNAVKWIENSGKWELHIAVNNETYGTSDLFDINYCPMCGRKLNNAPTDER